ncbi:RNA-guided pseudouridylation complex pseudouridine synthase subunit Cbf5 [Candidatus Pacearchaeota archaeon]|nr:RNA-guided pseudouridylation complex pseudouridine synthase subunit Cbf5 [Candidatus Pacearchaeota archaeon]
MQKTITELLNFGIIIVDKPTGPTSFSISDYVRKKLKLSKTSHFGTLDPMVTGVLPIALGRACRLTGDFLGHDKTYVGIMHTHKENDIKELQKIIDEKFSGKIMQLPPKKSRVKREIREREIKRFELLEVSEDKKDFLFIAEVQGGTYIRKLCSDLGDLIGGAHMAELRRTQAGVFVEKQAVNLYDFDKAVEEHEKGNSNKLRALIIPADEALCLVLPKCEVKEFAVFALKTGKPLFRNDTEKLPTENKFAVFCKNKFIGIYNKVDERGDVVAKAQFVFN